MSSSLSNRQAADLDRYITGNYGEDQFAMENRIAFEDDRDNPPDDNGPAIASVEQIGDIAEHYGVDGILRALAEHCEERSRFWCREFGKCGKDFQHDKAMSYMRWLAAIQRALKEGGG